MAFVLPYPWSLLAPRGDFGFPVSLEVCATSEPLNAESLTLFTRDDDFSISTPDGRRHHAVPLTQINAETGRSPFRILSLPWRHDNSEALRVVVGGEEYTIPVHGNLRRAGALEELSEHNKEEIALREIIHLLNAYFREAISLTHEAAFRAFAGHGIARLEWSPIWERWKPLSRREEPRTARIVEIAFAHLAQIGDVCARPRRMLVRQREATPIGRVQELDQICLRDLIRRPGRTILEKAGDRQEILGITRRETVDTAENRIIRDFLRLCQHRARAYERENGSFREHPKVRKVADLRRDCERLDLWSPIASAGRLVGIPRPNYVLQKDRRYHPLWVQYDKLRKEEEEVDNVWAWGRRLWAEFIRGVVVSFLCSTDGHASCGWHCDGDLAAYLRAEHQAGTYLPGLSVSSRWLQPDGRARLFVVHPAHAHLCPNLEETLPRLGAELALVVYPPENEPQRPRALLCIYSVLSLRTSAQEREAMKASLRSTLDNVARQNPGLHVRGLLLRGESNGEHPAECPRIGLLDALNAPAGGPFWFDLFPVKLVELLEELVK